MYIPSKRTHCKHTGDPFVKMLMAADGILQTRQILCVRETEKVIKNIVNSLRGIGCTVLFQVTRYVVKA